MDHTTDQADNSGPQIKLPKAGRLVGIDFGTVRVGIALCDESQSIASPLETYNRKTEAEDARYFETLAAEYSVVGYVVGLPLHMSGDESQKSLEARAFGQWLSSLTNRPVVWMDERYSTRFAKELLRGGNLSAKKRKARIDKIAAQAILVAYLESPDATTNFSSID